MPNNSPALSKFRHLFLNFVQTQAYPFLLEFELHLFIFKQLTKIKSRNLQ